jgi:hypothetical protein
VPYLVASPGPSLAPEKRVRRSPLVLQRYLLLLFGATCAAADTQSGSTALRRSVSRTQDTEFAGLRRHGLQREKLMTRTAPHPSVRASCGFDVPRCN